MTVSENKALQKNRGIEASVSHPLGAPARPSARDQLEEPDVVVVRIGDLVGEEGVRIPCLVEVGPVDDVSCVLRRHCVQDGVHGIAIAGMLPHILKAHVICQRDGTVKGGQHLRA